MYLGLAVNKSLCGLWNFESKMTWKTLSGPACVLRIIHLLLQQQSEIGDESTRIVHLSLVSILINLLNYSTPSQKKDISCPFSDCHELM